MAKNKAKTRVLVATGIYPPDIGGPATYSKLLKDELPLRGIDVDVLSFGRVRRFPSGLRHFLYFSLLLIKGLKADVIYAQDPVSVGFPALLASNVLDKSFILKIVGDYAWEQGTARFGVKDSMDDFSLRKNGYSFFVRALKAIQKQTAEGADLVIVPSKYLEKIVSNWGINKNHIKVIYNSFDPPTNLASKEVLRQMMGLSGNVILSIGRLVPWKGFSTLIDVMGEVRSEVPDAKLLIIGSGIDERKLEKKIKKTGAAEYVTLVGQLDHETLLRYIQASDLFVLNTFYEGFSHQILECMALGVPVVTTKVGGNVEIIEDKVNGVLVSYNDEKALKTEIVELLKSEKSQKRYAKNAKEKVSEFGRDRMLKGISRTLKNI